MNMIGFISTIALYNALDMEEMALAMNGIIISTPASKC